jgi:isoquinoline 1-oxidoreductase beta subunit
MAQGGITDAVGVSMFGELTFEDGMPQKRNFDTYRMVRMPDAPKNIDVHFVQNDFGPTGLGEPPFPPTMPALANALYAATGKRFRRQPYINDLES